MTDDRKPWPFPTGRARLDAAVQLQHERAPVAAVLQAPAGQQLLRDFQNAELRALLRRAAAMHGWRAVINAAIAEENAQAKRQQLDVDDMRAQVLEHVQQRLEAQRAEVHQHLEGTNFKEGP
jgi:DUF1680 family protein